MFLFLLLEQLAAETKRLQESDIPLQQQLRAGLKKYERALLLKGKSLKKPHGFFQEARLDIPLHRGEQEKEGTQALW